LGTGILFIDFSTYLVNYAFPNPGFRYDGYIRYFKENGEYKQIILHFTLCGREILEVQNDRDKVFFFPNAKTI